MMLLLIVWAILLSWSALGQEQADNSSSVSTVPANWCFHPQLPGLGGKWTYLDPDTDWSGACALGKEQSPVELPREGKRSNIRRMIILHFIFSIFTH